MVVRDDFYGKHTNSATLATLPPELLTLICDQLEVADLIHLESTAKHFHEFMCGYLKTRKSIQISCHSDQKDRRTVKSITKFITERCGENLNEINFNCDKELKKRVFKQRRMSKKFKKCPRVSNIREWPRDQQNIYEKFVKGARNVRTILIDNRYSWRFF